MESLFSKNTEVVIEFIKSIYDSNRKKETTSAVSIFKLNENCVISTRKTVFLITKDFELLGSFESEFNIIHVSIEGERILIIDEHYYHVLNFNLVPLNSFELKSKISVKNVFIFNDKLFYLGDMKLVVHFMDQRKIHFYSIPENTSELFSVNNSYLILRDKNMNLYHYFSNPYLK